MGPLTQLSDSFSDLHSRLTISPNDRIPPHRGIKQSFAPLINSLFSTKSVRGRSKGSVRLPHKYPTIPQRSLCIFIAIVFALAQFTLAQSAIKNDFGCHCMEYWTCITSGGHPYSYCGLSDSSVCCFVALNAQPIGILPFPKKGKSCGKKGADSAKDGQAEMSEWPWHAALLEGSDDLYLCGASLVSERWILTAAHCVDDYYPYSSSDSRLKVRLGEYDVSTTAEPLKHEEHKIQRIVLHPEFDNSTLRNDIALLQIERPAARRPHIEAVCMPKVNDFTPGFINKCYITGWGRKDEASDHSVVLKEIPVPLWENRKCQETLKKHFGSTYFLPTTAICAGSEGKDACDGDGGGPLVCEKGGHWYQVGVVSFGIGCGRKDVPGVYTRVDAFTPWIEAVTGVKAKKSSSNAHKRTSNSRLRLGN